jgi:hypothetical protein
MGLLLSATGGQCDYFTRSLRGGNREILLDALMQLLKWPGPDIQDRAITAELER